MNKRTGTILLTIASLFVTSCAFSQLLPPTPTPEPTATPTRTPRPTATPTATPLPGGILAGRVYLVDRDEAVRTEVMLLVDEENETIDSTTTNSDGSYSFLIEDEGIYVVRIAVTDLLDDCDDLSSSSRDWPVVVRMFGGSGVTDVLAGSRPITVHIGDEITLDLDLTCD